MVFVVWWEDGMIPTITSKKMNPIRLEALYLTHQSLKIAKRQVEQLAMKKWNSAGCPMSSSRDFWQEAQAEWIEHRYVPDTRVMEAVG